MFRKITALCLVLFSFSESAYAFGTGAEGSVLIEADTKQIIFADRENKRLPMASTTKIMTALVALEKGNLKDIIKVSENAQNQEGSSVYLRAGDEISLEDLLFGLMLNSGNDAAVAIAEGVGGDSEGFVRMMNEKAAEIGLKNTEFQNPNGLSAEGHYSSAYDLALIFSKAMEFEEFRRIVSKKEYQIKTGGAVTYLRNHNRLLWQYDGCIGGKTGYTKDSGRCLVSCAERDGVRLICVTLNDRNDWQDHKNMFEYGFSKLEKVQIIEKGTILCTKNTKLGRINVLASEDFSVPLLGGNKRGLSLLVNLKIPEKEISVGSDIGYGDVFLNNEKIGRISLMSGQEYHDKSRIFSDCLKRIIKLTRLK